MPKTLKEKPAQCISDPTCDRPVIAKGRCDTHYHRYIRHSDESAPVRQKSKSDLMSLSLRVSSKAFKELEKAGGAYGEGVAVIEEWAKRQEKKKASRSA